jgi:hypothetical protein
MTAMEVAMDRRAFLVSLAAFAALPARAEDWPTEPQAIVTRLYGFYKKDSKGAYADKQVHARYFSASLEALVKKAEAKSRKINEPIIDFDPVINGQDWDAPKALQVTVESSEADKQTLKAKYTVFNEPNFVIFDFVREKDAWRIFDLRGGEGKDAWSLRKIAKT